MQPHSITVNVSSEAASAYRAASESSRRAIAELVEILLGTGRKVSHAEFRRSVEALGAEAKRKGLTEEKLKEILEDE